MFKALRNSAKKLLVTGAIAIAISAGATAASANTLTQIGGGLILSCGSSAGNYIINTNTGDYMHGGVWQFIADLGCNGV